MLDKSRITLIAARRAKLLHLLSTSSRGATMDRGFRQKQRKDLDRGLGKLLSAGTLAPSSQSLIHPGSRMIKRDVEANIRHFYLQHQFLRIIDHSVNDRISGQHPIKNSVVTFFTYLFSRMLPSWNNGASLETIPKYNSYMDASGVSTRVRLQWSTQHALNLLMTSGFSVSKTLCIEKSIKIAYWVHCQEQNGKVIVSYDKSTETGSIIPIMDDKGNLKLLDKF